MLENMQLYIVNNHDPTFGAVIGINLPNKILCYVYLLTYTTAFYVSYFYIFFFVSFVIKTTALIGRVFAMEKARIVADLTRCE